MARGSRGRVVGRIAKVSGSSRVDDGRSIWNEQRYCRMEYEQRGLSDEPAFARRGIGGRMPDAVTCETSRSVSLEQGFSPGYSPGWSPRVPISPSLRVLRE